MEMNGVIQIIKPEPDSQYRLLPCACGSDNAAYVQYRFGAQDLWRVECFDCHRIAAPQTPVRHAAQCHWNGCVPESS